MSKNKLLNIIIRFHDPSEQNLQALSFCLFCLYGQDYRPIQPIIALQGLNDDAVKRVNDVVDEMPWGDIINPDIHRPIVHNMQIEKPGDYRSKLINEGFKLAEGSYLAILDFDDIIYGDAYSYLIKKLQMPLNNAAIVFGNIKRVDCVPMNGFLHQLNKLVYFNGNDRYDLFVDNFCPIHSFVIDREKIDKSDLFFNETLSKCEDYEFLLRIVAKYESDFTSRDRFIGEYLMRTDGTNTITIHDNDKSNQDLWSIARNDIQNLRESTTTEVKLSELADLKQAANSATHLSNQVASLQEAMRNKESEIAVLKFNQREVTANRDISKQLFGFACLNNTIQNDKLVGHVDNITSDNGLTQFKGWAADIEQKATVLALAITINNIIFLITQTTLPRPDIVKTFGILTDNCGFSINIPTEIAENINDINILALLKNGVIYNLKWNHPEKALI